MIQAAIKPITFTEFVEFKPDGGNYELHDRVIVEMQPKGKHEEIIGFLATEFILEFRRLNLPYFIPKQALVKVENRETAYSPDILILNRKNLVNESLWNKYSTVQTSASIPLVVEIVSSNWRDDYLTKVRDYEEIAIIEYWIVDYLGVGGRRYIGNPKQPTISIYNLLDGEYLVNQYKEKDVIISPNFSELNLTVEQIFNCSSSD
ncbi:MAG: Uma2 family endonuclease [Xenococcaceae cyanobacterium]